MPAALAPDACPLVASMTQPATAAAVAASQRAPGRPGDGHDRPDGDAGAGGGGEEGRLVNGGSCCADGEQAPGARPAGNQSAQRAATQRHEKEQQAAADDAGCANCYWAGTGRRESPGGRGGAPQGGGEQNARGPAKGPGYM